MLFIAYSQWIIINILVFINIAEDETENIWTRYDNIAVGSILELYYRYQRACNVLLYNVPNTCRPMDLAYEILDVLGLAKRVVSAKWINVEWDFVLLVKMEDRRFVMEVMKLKDQLRYHPKWNLVSAYTDGTTRPPLNEAYQRLQKACNVFLYNVPRISSPTHLACEILGVLGLANRVVSAKWINSNWNSPLLVKMEDRRSVLEVLKLKAQLRCHPQWYFISANKDMTHHQQHQMRCLRAEMKRRREEGEPDLAVIYINGEPDLGFRRPQNTRTYRCP